ncbi:hypothetical protein OUY22_03085 [Nonomuraea sp. MCN248]|uniref:Uncharacterized protein n=1 Tax=Nonomuraea corallina TaxID=2989783 RepID=A0ABT4S5B0_9ACTN|nr:hypothetical protein [Nonomuraea corallina]MDA0632386.1 hypothetical protein [Nonomuraea corallina]
MGPADDRYALQDRTVTHSRTTPDGKRVVGSGTITFKAGWTDDRPSVVRG